METFADAAGAAAPSLSALGGAVLRRLCRAIVHGTLTVVVPNGARFTHRAGEPGPEATIVIHRWRMLPRVLLGGDVGFGEAYMDGDWSSPDVPRLIELGVRNDASLGPMSHGAAPVRALNRLVHLWNANTPSGSRRNIVAHYDLGNEFYARWLDPGMSYSAALYRHPAMTLEEAQAAKQDRVIELLSIVPGHAVMEIGCGWGGLAGQLAARGCHVTALTLSPAQRDWAARALAAAGLDDRVELRLQDYREAGGRYDRIVSIEMLEAVGEAYWPVYFDRLRARLKPGGVAVLQVITIADERFARYRKEADFVQRHVFPGGMLPSPRAMRDEIGAAGLRIDSVETFGESYARTLREWRHRFDAAWPEIAALGFSERFRRMWEFYLAYCEAGFRAGAVDIGLWRLTHTA
jgi:cyclopropane-fatty-acyl-phospholipid synthase